jgi:hypothetical protein
MPKALPYEKEETEMGIEEEKKAIDIWEYESSNSIENIPYRHEDDWSED